MKKAWSAVLAAIDWFDAEDDPNVPAYDPVHLAALLITLLVVVGALYWLLWTLLVYEGGLFGKIMPALSVLFTSKTLADYGYRGMPYAMGAFEGWVGNVGALAIGLLVLYALNTLYRDAARHHQDK